MSGNLRKILQDFLDNREQRAVLNGYLSWANATTGIHQDSILGLLLLSSYY